MKNGILALALLLMAFAPLAAQEYIAPEVFLTGRGVEMLDATASSEVTLSRLKGNVLLASIKEEVIDSSWKSFAVTFVPSASGKVSIELSGSDGAPDTQYVAYDSLTATGAILKNGSFEIPATQATSKVKMWWGDASNSQVYKDAVQAHSGETFVLARPSVTLETHMTVTEGQSVTLLFFTKRVAFAPVE
jgi:hypothetical protein